MAENKPKIYAFCEAGCKWETVHKDDVACGGGGGRVFNHCITVNCSDDNGMGYVTAYINIVSTRESAYADAYTGLFTQMLNKDIAATGWASYEIFFGPVSRIRFTDEGIQCVFSYAEEGCMGEKTEVFMGYIQIEDTVIEVT